MKYLLILLCSAVGTLHAFSNAQLHIINATDTDATLYIIRYEEGPTEELYVKAGGQFMIPMPTTAEVGEPTAIGWDVMDMSYVSMMSGGQMTIVKTETGYFFTMTQAFRDATADYYDIPSIIEIPVIGEVTMPDWALYNTEYAMFFIGFAFGAGILIFRASLRWFKRADGTNGEN